MVGLVDRTTELPNASGIFGGAAAQDFGTKGVTLKAANVLGQPANADLSVLTSALRGDTIGAAAIANRIVPTIGAPAHTGGSIQKPQEMSLIS